MRDVEDGPAKKLQKTYVHVYYGPKGTFRPFVGKWIGPTYSSDSDAAIAADNYVRTHWDELRGDRTLNFKEIFEQPLSNTEVARKKRDALKAARSRKCTRCNLIKSKIEFYRLASQCKMCMKENAKNLREERNTQNAPIPVSKICVRCLTDKPANMFYCRKRTHDGLDSSCKSCLNTERAFFTQVLNAARSSAKMRLRIDERNGNKMRGVCTLTNEELRNLLLVQQQWRCAISGMIMSMDSWAMNRASLDRVDQSKGYELGNVRFVCFMFNQASQMSAEKLFYICHHQDEPLPDVWFNENAELIEKSCQNLMKSVRTSSGKNKRKACRITRGDLVETFKKQKGLCYYTGVRLRLGKRLPCFQISVERVNRAEAYTRDNIVLIIQEFNVGGRQNMSREIVDEIKRLSCIPGEHDMNKISKKFEDEYQEILHSFTIERPCSHCNITCQPISFPFFSSVCRICIKLSFDTKEVNEPPEKPCRKCGIVKPIDQFGWYTSAHRRHSAICISCRSLCGK